MPPNYTGIVCDTNVSFTTPKVTMYINGRNIGAGGFWTLANTWRWDTEPLGGKYDATGRGRFLDEAEFIKFLWDKFKDDPEIAAYLSAAILGNNA